MFEAGGAGSEPALYSASGSRWTESGSLVDGEVLLGEGSSIVRVMLPKSDGSLLRLNVDGPLVLRDYFGSSGDGADLTVWIQTAQGAVSFAASDVRSVGYGEIPPRQKDIAYPDHRQALRMRCSPWFGHCHSSASYWLVRVDRCPHSSGLIDRPREGRRVLGEGAGLRHPHRH